MARRKVTPQPSLGTMDKLLEGMNPEQQLAIQHKDGPLVVLAGAGSGKTRVLVHRVAMLIQSGVPEERILSVTFSKNAADEMRDRARQLGIGAEFRTWHSLALNILREDGTHWSEWKIDDTNRSQYVLKEVTGYKGMKWNDVDINALQSFVGFCKSQLWDADSDEAFNYAQTRGLGGKAIEAYHRYQCSMTEQGLITFDDFLVFCVEHLETTLGAQERWSGRWDYVLQDEAQDANPAQLRIAELLTKGHRNYMVVGDPAQSIYGFRGSHPQFLIGFEKEWKATMVTMHRNYRCGSEIIRVANNVIRSSENRLPQDITAEGGWAGVVEHRSPASLEEEASDVVGAIQEHASNGSKLGQCVVLYRLNAQSRGIEEALLASQIPYVVVGGVSFYERKEVKDLLAYLRLMVGRQARESIKRALNAPFRFLGAAYLDKVLGRLQGRAGTTDDAVRAVVGACDDARVQARQRSSAAVFCELLQWGAGAVEDGLRPFDILERILGTTGYEDWLRRDSGEESLENSHVANVKELVRVSEKFATVEALLDFVDQTIDAAKANAEKSKGCDRVLLMSIHKSKGLEFKHVHLIGVCEMILPHPRNEDQDEERRLCYVAMTRAKETLLVTSPRRIAVKKGIIDVDTSRFVTDAQM